MLNFITLTCALAAISSALPSSSIQHSKNVSPIPPKQDPFYTAPPDFEAKPPGTILRMRPAPGNLTTVYNASSAAYNILYRTSNSLYQPSWAVTTLFIPHSPGQELLSYQIPYNTVDVDHSPSYGLYHELVSSVTLNDINTPLSYGWYVNVPDFEGPLPSFASGVEEGHAVIDSVRASLSHLALKEARYALWGYSGGSIASEWAAELQVQYAPELNFSGMAIGGLVPNVTTIVSSIDGTPAAALIPALLIGLTNQYPEAYQFLLDSLRTSGVYNRTGFLEIQNLSYAEGIPVYYNQSILQDYFVNGSSFLHSPIMQKLINRDGEMGYHGVPQMPTFVYKAIQDEYSPVEDTDDLVARYCEVGAKILYQRNTAGYHLDEYYNGDARALNWLRGVLNGSGEISPGCIIQNVTVDIVDQGPFGLG